MEVLGDLLVVRLRVPVARIARVRLVVGVEVLGGLLDVALAAPGSRAVSTLVARLDLADIVLLHRRGATPAASFRHASRSSSARISSNMWGSTSFSILLVPPSSSRGLLVDRVLVLGGALTLN